jgi:hypothetical protein
MMMKWVKERCNKERVSAYLQSTLEAYRFYEKNRFVNAGSFCVTLKGTTVNGQPEVYREVGFLYLPRTVMGELWGLLGMCCAGQLVNG